MRWLLSCFGICWHGRTGFPQTSRLTKLTTVQCFDCGKRVCYDWSAMKMGEEI